MFLSVFASPFLCLYLRQPTKKPTKSPTRKPTEDPTKKPTGSGYGQPTDDDGTDDTVGTEKNRWKTTVENDVREGASNDWAGLTHREETQVKCHQTYDGGVCTLHCRDIKYWYHGLVEVDKEKGEIRERPCEDDYQ